MRMASGFTKSITPDDPTTAKRTQIVSTVGAIDPPTTDNLIREAKLLLGQALIASRNITDSVTLAKNLQHICGALARIVSIDKLESIDFKNMSDDELRTTAERLIKNLN